MAEDIGDGLGKMADALNASADNNKTGFNDIKQGISELKDGLTSKNKSNEEVVLPSFIKDTFDKVSQTLDLINSQTSESNSYIKNWNDENKEAFSKLRDWTMATGKAGVKEGDLIALPALYSMGALYLGGIIKSVFSDGLNDLGNKISKDKKNNKQAKLQPLQDSNISAKKDLKSEKDSSSAPNVNGILILAGDVSKAKISVKDFQDLMLETQKAAGMKAIDLSFTQKKLDSTLKGVNESIETAASIDTKKAKNAKTNAKASMQSIVSIASDMKTLVKMVPFVILASSLYGKRGIATKGLVLIYEGVSNGLDKTSKKNKISKESIDLFKSILLFINEIAISSKATVANARYIKSLNSMFDKDKGCMSMLAKNLQQFSKTGIMKNPESLAKLKDFEEVVYDLASCIEAIAKVGLFVKPASASISPIIKFIEKLSTGLEKVNLDNLKGKDFHSFSEQIKDFKEMVNNLSVIASLLAVNLALFLIGSVAIKPAISLFSKIVTGIGGLPDTDKAEKTMESLAKTMLKFKETLLSTMISAVILTASIAIIVTGLLGAILVKDFYDIIIKMLSSPLLDKALVDKTDIAIIVAKKLIKFAALTLAVTTLFTVCLVPALFGSLGALAVKLFYFTLKSLFDKISFKDIAKYSIDDAIIVAKKLIKFAALTLAATTLFSLNIVPALTGRKGAERVADFYDLTSTLIPYILFDNFPESIDSAIIVAKKLIKFAALTLAATSIFTVCAATATAGSLGALAVRLFYSKLKDLFYGDKSVSFKKIVDRMGNAIDAATGLVKFASLTLVAALSLTLCLVACISGAISFASVALFYIAASAFFSNDKLKLPEDKIKEFTEAAAELAKFASVTLVACMCLALCLPFAIISCISLLAVALVFFAASVVGIAAKIAEPFLVDAAIAAVLLAVLAIALIPALMCLSIVSKLIQDIDLMSLVCIAAIFIIMTIVGIVAFIATIPITFATIAATLLVAFAVIAIVAVVLLTVLSKLITLVDPTSLFVICSIFYMMIDVGKAALSSILYIIFATFAAVTLIIFSVAMVIALALFFIIGLIISKIDIDNTTNQMIALFKQLAVVGAMSLLLLPVMLSLVITSILLLVFALIFFIDIKILSSIKPDDVMIAAKVMIESALLFSAATVAGLVAALALIGLVPLLAASIMLSIVSVNYKAAITSLKGIGTTDIQNATLALSGLKALFKVLPNPIASALYAAKIAPLVAAVSGLATIAKSIKEIQNVFKDLNTAEVNDICDKLSEIILGKPKDGKFKFGIFDNREGGLIATVKKIDKEIGMSFKPNDIKKLSDAVQSLAAIPQSLKSITDIMSQLDNETVQKACQQLAEVLIGKSKGGLFNIPWIQRKGGMINTVKQISKEVSISFKAKDIEKLSKAISSLSNITSSIKSITENMASLDADAVDNAVTNLTDIILGRAKTGVPLELRTGGLLSTVLNISKKVGFLFSPKTISKIVDAVKSISEMISPIKNIAKSIKDLNTDTFTEDFARLEPAIIVLGNIGKLGRKNLNWNTGAMNKYASNIKSVNGLVLSITGLEKNVGSIKSDSWWNQISGSVTTALTVISDIESTCKKNIRWKPKNMEVYSERIKSCEGVLDVMSQLNDKVKSTEFNGEAIKKGFTDLKSSIDELNGINEGKLKSVAKSISSSFDTLVKSGNKLKPFIKNLHELNSELKSFISNGGTSAINSSNVGSSGNVASKFTNDTKSMANKAEMSETKDYASALATVIKELEEIVKNTKQASVSWDA